MPKDEFSFRTILEPSQGLYREKGSRFLAFAYPVSSEADIKSYLSLIQKEYFDARHHCYAWILGREAKLFRAFDAGEPNHSAGDPILGQIRSKDLTNVLVVVVRYFGGVKLGVGGLIHAYKSAAEDALNHAQIVEKEVMEVVAISYDYVSTAEVMRMLKDFDLRIRSQEFDARCELIADFPLKHKEKLTEKLNLMKAMQTDVTYEYRVQ